MTHPLAQPYTLAPPSRYAAAYTQIEPIESDFHRYRILYIDDDNSKYQKELHLVLPAFTDLATVPARYSETKPWVLTGAHLVAVENLSLRNGLPLPF